MADRDSDAPGTPSWVDIGSIEQLGGQVLAPPFAVPDVGRMATVAGPLGEPFSLFQF